MTPFDLVLGDHGPALLLGAIALAAALTLLTALLQVALTRAGGPDPAALPDPLAEHGPKLVVLGGMPALILAALAATGMTLILGGRPNADDLQAARPLGLALSLGTLVAAVCLGLGPPLGEHWGAAVTGFGAGVGLLFPNLLVINQLPFAEDGSIAYPDRAVFALMVALLLVAIVLIAASLLGLAVSAWRVFSELRAARGVHRPAPSTPSRPPAQGHGGAQRAR